MRERYLHATVQGDYPDSLEAHCSTGAKVAIHLKHTMFIVQCTKLRNDQRSFPAAQNNWKPLRPDCRHQATAVRDLHKVSMMDLVQRGICQPY
jgi:hypothetical protein